MMEGTLAWGIIASEYGLGRMNSYPAAVYADVQNLLAQGDNKSRDGIRAKNQYVSGALGSPVFSH